MDIWDDMGVSKLSSKVFFKVNYSLNSILFYFMLNTELKIQGNWCHYTMISKHYRYI